jgi:hypothetical protein
MGIVVWTLQSLIKAEFASTSAAENMYDINYHLADNLYYALIQPSQSRRVVIDWGKPFFKTLVSA